MPAAALYVRVSTEDQARHGYSLAAQVEACRARAELLGASEVHLFADEGVSGALLTRPGLDALREAVRDRTLELVVVWDPDRLSRNLSHQLLLTEEIERARIRLEFVNFEWKATPEGQLFYALRGAIAQYEKEKIRERTGRGRLQKAKQGKLPLAFRPYGYDYDPATALLTPNEAEAGVVRSMFRWLLEEGEGPGAIARRLNDLGVPTRKGGRWHRAVVGQILRNPVYTGVFYANRWDTAGCSLNRHRPAGERVAPTLRAESEWVPVAVPPLVSVEHWVCSRELLGGARRLWSGKARADYLLSGLLVCGRCGCSMSGFTGTDWGVKRRKYTCRRKGAGGAWCGRTLAAEPLEEAVWGAVIDLVTTDPAALLATLDQARPDRLEPARAELAEAVARAEKGKATILQLIVTGHLTGTDAAEALTQAETRLAELARRQAELGAVVPVPQDAPLEPLNLEGLRADGLPPAERKLLLRTLVVRIHAEEGTARVEVRWPFAGAENSDRQ